MRYLDALLGALVLVLVFQQSKEDGPYSWASNVCSRSHYRTASYSSLTSRVAYKHYYTACGWFGWGRCQKSRAYHTYYYKTSYTSRKVTSYYCCSGWRRSGRKCSIPICSSGCVHGRCSSPNSCSCRSGWYGSRCQYDKNECSSRKGGCHQVCINTQGSYRCGCYRGYKKTGSRSCQDFNECEKSPCACASSSTACGHRCTNTQGSFRCSCGTGFEVIGSTICVDEDECLRNVCQQTCVNTIGSYRCSCRQGYLPRQNATYCDDIDECKTNNGNCEQICNNTDGSRQCACKEGYRLDPNGMTCTDIDECSEDSTCHQNCTNQIGSFTCFCRRGYRLNSDNRTCSDIDECQSRKIDGLVNAKYSLSKCEQTCYNTIGSYTCGCRSGFTLRRDKRSCKDIDECTLGSHQCNQTCVNTQGSYRCSCITGYEIHKDGKSCRDPPCTTLVQQPHGTMTCTGMSTTETCSFECNHGYYMEGPSNITCMSKSRWSSPQPTCKAKTCGMLKPQANAILSLPCFRTYGSSCIMRCASGYYHTGSSEITCILTGDKKGVTWKNDFKCHHVRSCMPNPCLHGGTCTPLTNKVFQCDCSNTGYEGKQCEHGVINLPFFPKLKANLQSSPLSFKAKPSKEIQISIQSDENVVAQPSKLKLFKSRNKAEVTLESKQPGLKVISFSVNGESAKDYKNPEESVLFVSPETPNENNIFTQFPLLPGELPVGCNVKRTDLFKCPAQLSSTQPWKQNPSTKQFSTKGLVHLISKSGTPIPLSLIGIDFPSNSYEGLLDRVKQISQLSKNVRVKKMNSKHACEATTLDVPQMMELVEHDAFAASFLSTFSKSTPSWLQIWNKNSSSLDIRDIHANMVSKTKTCSSIFKSSSVISYEPSIGATITGLGEDIVLPDERGFCYAIDVCTSDVGFTLPSESTKAIKSLALFQEMKTVGWDIDLTGAIFPGNGKATVNIGQSLWNGIQLENLESHEYEVMLTGKMKAKLENKEQIKISLDYQGDVFVDTNNITEVLHYGFARNITGILKGKAALNMTTTVFKKQINIQLPSQDVVGKSIWGVDTLHQGIALKWKKVPRLLQGTPLSTTIRPAMNKPVFVSLEHQVQGGNKIELLNLNDYNIKLMLIGFQVTQLKGILNNTQMNGLAKKETIKRWAGFIDELNTLVGDIRSAIKSKKNFTFSLLIPRLQKQLRDIRFLCKIIESVAKIKIPSTGSMLTAQVNQIATNLPQIPNPLFKRSAVSRRFHGFKILFQGKICSKRLCFEGLNVTLDSSRYKKDQGQNNPGIIVQGKAMQFLQLGKIMSLNKATKIVLRVPKEEAASTFTFNPSIHFMGLEKSVSCEIKQDTISFNTTGLLYGRHESFISVSAKTDVSDWSSLQYHISGSMEKNSRLPQQLHRKINNHIKDLAQKAVKRIENAESSAREAKQNFDIFQKISAERNALKSLEKKKKKMIIAKAKAKAEYERQKVHVHDFYGKEVNTVPSGCKLKKCDWVCSPTKQCTYKTENLKISVPQYKCEEKERIVYKERMVQRSEIGYYWDKTFVYYYTGNCRQTKIEQVTGPVGGIIGTMKIPVPVVGTLFGYTVGHMVGLALNDLSDSIFGCDQTVESKPGPNIRKTYTKIWSERVKYEVREKVLICSDPIQEPKVIEDSYTTPKQTCTNNACIMVMNAKCVKDNNDCYDRKQDYRLNSRKSRYEQEKYQDFYQLNSLANKLEIATIDLYKVHAKYDKMLEETKLAKAQLEHLELAKNRTKAAISNLKAFPSTKLGLKLSELLEKTSHERTVHLSDFKFDYTLTHDTKRQIPITVTVKSIDGKKKELSTLFDFDKEEVSLRQIVIQIIKDLYEDERGARRKKSIPEEMYNRVNKSEENQKGIKSLRDLDLCLEAKKANLFYKEIVKSLEDLVDAREQVERVNRNDIEKLTSVYQTFENMTSHDTQSGNDTLNSQGMSRTYLDYIGSIIEDKSNFSMMSWNESLISWRAFLEVLTKEEAFPNCAGAQDCLIDIRDDLEELYLYESDFPRANDIRMTLSNVTARLIDLISQNFTVEEIRYKIHDLQYLLNHTEDTNVLCGRKPDITFALCNPEVVVENETLTMFCNATSDTKVTYQWIHNNGSVIQTENGSLTIQKVNTSHAGSYKCKAINRKGFAISNVTIISVKSKPKITEHPNDTKVYAQDGKGLLLVCNATGDPEPDIEWFFISHYPNSSEVKIYNDNGTFLYYDQYTSNYSGYYYCIARNRYGQVRSRKARVWVLDMSPGEPRLGATINVTKTCKSQRKLSWCGKVQSVRDLPLLTKALIESLDNPESNVKNIKFVSKGLQSATVSFLYASKKTPTKEVLNEAVRDPVLESFARKRKTLASGLQAWYQKLKNNSSPIVNVYYEEISGNAESLTAWVAQPGCSRGQGPHSSGYMCYNCPPGTYGAADGQCTPCPIKTYQYEQGQTKCIPCSYGFTTKKEGAMSPDECYDMPSRIFSNVTAYVIGQTAKITWKNKDGDLKSQVVVYYGKQEAQMDRKATCQAQLCKIRNLEAGTTYYAEIHVVGQNDVSKVVSFTTAWM